jgi:hypothetical protein
MAGADTILKQATETDLAAIGMIASAIHPELTERREVFAVVLLLATRSAIPGSSIEFRRSTSFWEAFRPRRIAFSSTTWR